MSRRPHLPTAVLVAVVLLLAAATLALLSVAAVELLVIVPLRLIQRVLEARP